MNRRLAVIQIENTIPFEDSEDKVVETMLQMIIWPFATVDSTVHKKNEKQQERYRK